MKNQDDSNESSKEQEKTKQNEDQNGVDGDYDFDQLKMDEQLFDTDSNKQSSEKVFQKLNANIYDKEYKVFTKQFDEIEKAELLETNQEILKLRKKYERKIRN